MVTSLYAGILGLIYVALGVYVIMGRLKSSVGLEQGQGVSKQETFSGTEEKLHNRLRAYQNFMEYTPFVLILLILGEVEGVAEWLLHILGSLLVMGRLFHALGSLNILSPVLGRGVGVTTTLLVLVIAAILCIKAYFIF